MLALPTKAVVESTGSCVLPMVRAAFTRAFYSILGNTFWRKPSTRSDPSGGSSTMWSKKMRRGLSGLFWVYPVDVICPCISL
jgi:hypothetical protein